MTVNEELGRRGGGVGRKKRDDSMREWDRLERGEKLPSLERTLVNVAIFDGYKLRHNYNYHLNQKSFLDIMMIPNYIHTCMNFHHSVS